VATESPNIEGCFTRVQRNELASLLNSQLTELGCPFPPRNKQVRGITVRGLIDSEVERYGVPMVNDAGEPYMLVAVAFSEIADAGHERTLVERILVAPDGAELDRDVAIDEAG
jgi:hypothetical protein